VSFSGGHPVEVTAADLRSIYFVDNQHGYAVGSVNKNTKGRLLRTKDGGTTWEYNSDPNVLDTPLNAVAVVGGGADHTLVVVGDGGAIKKAKVTWDDDINTVAQNLAAGAVVSPTTAELKSLAFPGGGASGYAAGAAGAVIYSSDSGANWVLKAGGVTASALYGSSFIDAQTGWLVGADSTVVHTTDGGYTWNDDKSGIPPNVSLHDVQFLKNATGGLEGFAVGCEGDDCSTTGTGTGVAYKYSSGSWTSMTVPPGVTNLRSLHMTDGNHGWAVGPGGMALKTTDGSTWILANAGIEANHDHDLNDVDLNDVDAIDPSGNDGWVVGQDKKTDKGILLKYDPASNKWSEVTLSDVPSFLSAIDMVNTDTGYAVGNDGYVFKTTDGGANWIKQNSGTSKTLAAVSFSDANNGFAVGDEGRIIHTLNGGATWSAENAGTTNPHYTFSAISGRQAFVGGHNGAVLKANRPYYFTWYDNVYGQNWVLMANPQGAASPLSFDLFIAGLKKNLSGYNNGKVNPGESITPIFPGVIGGPVNAASLTSDKAIVSQRSLWAGNSLEEVLGQDIDKLSDHFWWTWYDQQSPGMTNWVLIANPNPFQVWCEIKVAGQLKYSGYVQAGQNVTPTFSGLMGGPVEVQAWTTAGKTAPANIIASQRVLHNGYFNEVLGTVLN
jgi:photosystem II stability/assembly factor-like uncharacterized protein